MSLKIENPDSNSKNEIQNETSLPSTVGITASIGIGVILSTFTITAIIISTYKLQEFLQVTTSVIQWIIICYLIIIVLLSNLAKNVGEKYGYKVIFQFGMIVFSFGALILIFSKDFAFIIIGIIIEAIGSSAVLGNANILLMKNSVSKSQKSIITINKLMIAIGLISGSSLGSILTFYIGWQGIFIFDLLLGLLDFFMVQNFIPTENITESNRILDYYGIIMFATFIIFEIYGIAIIDILNNTSLLLALIFIFVGLFSFLSIISNSNKFMDQFIDVKLFKDKNFIIGISTTILSYSIMFMVLYQLPLFVQKFFGVSIILIGFIVTSIPLAWIIIHSLAEPLADSIEPKLITPIAFLGMIFILIVLILITTENFYWFYTLVTISVLGALIGLFTTINEVHLMKVLPKNNFHSLNELLALARNFGFVIGIVFSTMLIDNFIPYYIKIFGVNTDYFVIYISSYQSMLLFAMVLAFIGAVFSFQRSYNNKYSKTNIKIRR